MPARLVPLLCVASLVCSCSERRDDLRDAASFADASDDAGLVTLPRLCTGVNEQLVLDLDLPTGTHLYDTRLAVVTMPHWDIVVVAHRNEFAGGPGFVVAAIARGTHDIRILERRPAAQPQIVSARINGDGEVVVTLLDYGPAAFLERIVFDGAEPIVDVIDTPPGSPSFVVARMREGVDDILSIEYAEHSAPRLVTFEWPHGAMPSASRTIVDPFYGNGVASSVEVEGGVVIASPTGETSSRVFWLDASLMLVSELSVPSPLDGPIVPWRDNRIVVPTVGGGPVERTFTALSIASPDGTLTPFLSLPIDQRLAALVSTDDRISFVLTPQSNPGARAFPTESATEASYVGSITRGAPIIVSGLGSPALFGVDSPHAIAVSDERTVVASMPTAGESIALTYFCEMGAL